MNDKNDIIKEIEAISPLLASLRDRQVFLIPEGYFARFYDNLENAISNGNDALNPGGLKLESPLSVPEGYFNNLSSAILQKIKDVEVAANEDENQLINIIGNEKINVFSVPAGYFDSLPKQILIKIKGQSGGKVISIFRRPVFRYAIAAAIAAILLITGFFKLTSNELPRDGFAVVNKNTVPIADALQYNSEKAFEKGIESLSDDQIIAYLERSGSILDNPSLIGNSNSTGMPDPMEYLEDEKALDNYLNNNQNNSNKKY